MLFRISILFLCYLLTDVAATEPMIEQQCYRLYEELCADVQSKPCETFSAIYAKREKVQKTEVKDIRGMLPLDKAEVYKIPLSGKPDFKTYKQYKPYLAYVDDYREALIEEQTDLMRKWVASDQKRFMKFLRYWKQSIIDNK